MLLGSRLPLSQWSGCAWSHYHCERSFLCFLGCHVCCLLPPCPKQSRCSHSILCVCVTRVVHMCACVHMLEARGNARNDPLWPPPYLFRQDLSICIASYKAQGTLQKARKSPRAGGFGGVLWNVLVDTCDLTAALYLYRTRLSARPE